jgi:hypothetical protein
MVATGFQIILSVAALCHFQAGVSLDFKPLSIQHKDRKVCKNPMSGARARASMFVMGQERLESRVSIDGILHLSPRL